MERVNYAGWNDCVRLTNGTVEVIVTTAVGPRIIHYGFVGGPNVFQVIPASQGQTGGDGFVGYGGHRLWVAPEALPRSYNPDNGPVQTVTEEGGWLVVANGVEPESGFAKEMRIRVNPEGSGVVVEHKITNHLPWPVSAASWGLNIVANDGYVVFPQEPFVSHDDDLLPARPVVLWKFTDMADPRWRWGTKYITLKQTEIANKPQKVGVYNAQGWAAHVTADGVFIVQIDVAPGGPAALTDQGSNYETYTDGPFQELETVGPFRTVEPGKSTGHTEYWTLSRSGGIPNSDDALDEHLLPLVRFAKAEHGK